MEVHHGSAEDIPAVKTVFKDHSRLHGAHVDYVEGLRVFDQEIRERIIAIVGEGPQTLVVVVIGKVGNLKASVFSIPMTIDKPNALRPTHQCYDFSLRVFEGSFDCLIFEVLLFMVKLKREYRIVVWLLILLDLDKDPQHLDQHICQCLDTYNPF